MSDRALLDATFRAARDERLATADLLALLAELDTRRLYLGEGCSSLFTYCTQVLHLSEHAAYHRIEAARAVRQFPIMLQRVADGSVTLTTVAMLRPHLTHDNHEALLDAARHKSKREVEHQIACLAPRPDAKTLIRRMPEERAYSPEVLPSAPAGPTVATAKADQPRPIAAPLASDRYLLRVTLSAKAHNELRRAQDLLRHAIPSGDPARIVERALTVLVDHLERSKVAKVTTRHTVARRANGQRRSRHIPAHVRRAVWARDEGRCAFVGPPGRCRETARLEFHHLVPFARGGSTETANIALRCRAHNGFESEQIFGPWSPLDDTRRLGPDRAAPR